jgi:oxygen-independent coproporphyrinogen-3 oxidase
MRAEKTISEAVAIGFDSVNLDIIFSIPGQTNDTLDYTLNKALELGTDHFSAYSLIYEPGTPLYNDWKAGKLTRPNDDQDAAFYEKVQETLAAGGLKQYEVSNFSRPGKECSHNLHAWQAGEYFAFGVSSHGYIEGERYANHRDIAKWKDDIACGRLPIAEKDIIHPRTTIEENIFLPIRADGIDTYIFKRNTGKELPNELINRLQIWVERGYVEPHQISVDRTRYQLTAKGYRYCDSITYDLIDAL